MLVHGLGEPAVTTRGGRAAEHLGFCRARLRPVRPRRIRRAARWPLPDTRLLDDLADMIETHPRPPAARPAAGAAGPQHGRPGGGAAGVAEPVPGGCAGAVIARAGCGPGPCKSCWCPRCPALRPTCAWGAQCQLPLARRAGGGRLPGRPRCHDRISARLARFIATAGPATVAACAWAVPTLLMWAGATGW